MDKLMKIKGYMSLNFNSLFDEYNMWEGEIILHDDGWFEGIANDKNKTELGDSFIFGVYFPSKIIHLHKFVPISLSLPILFHNKRDAKGYVGQFEEINLLGSEPMGASWIITDDFELTNGDEIEKLEEKIQNYKDTIMDETGKEFYDNSLAIRNSMCKIILAEAEGKSFNKRECKEINTN